MIDVARMMTGRLTTRTAVVIAAPVLAMLAGGCGSDDRVSEFRRNPTPRMDTLYETHDDIHNALTLKVDTEWRMFTRDFGWAWFADRPSRLNPIQIPH